MGNTPRPRGLRAAMKKRTVRKSYYDIPQVDFTVAQKAAEELVLAKNTLKAAEFLAAREPGSTEIKDAVAASRREVETQQAKVDECFFRVWFLGMPEEDFDALVNLHPPTEEQREKAKLKGEAQPTWNEASFPYELLEHCAQESDLTADQWRTETASWTIAERRDLFKAVLECNLRSFSGSLDFE